MQQTVGDILPAIPPISTERALRRARGALLSLVLTRASGSLLSGSNSLKFSSTTESAYRGRTLTPLIVAEGRERERERERERGVSDTLIA